MRKVWIVSDAIVSSLGFSTEENYTQIVNKKSGIKKIEEGAFGNFSFHGSAMDTLKASDNFTRFENLVMQAAKGALKNYSLEAEKTLFILSTTKGNVDVLKDNPKHARISLHATATHLAAHLGLQHSLVVSNACISGVLALIVAKRFLSNGKFDHALVVGADVLSSFIVEGFQSLHALSEQPCKPFDKDRSGINLGEGAGAMLLSVNPAAFGNEPVVEITGGGLTNDANHISGPSRTGVELATAVSLALKSAGIQRSQVDAISAHGTATVYNDEMEAKAFAHAAMEHIPLNSLKAYYGHTLGASGVIETIISKHAMERDEIIGTLGFDTSGVSTAININRDLIKKTQSKILKTASGFGGCNAALILEKR